MMNNPEPSFLDRVFYLVRNNFFAPSLQGLMVFCFFLPFCTFKCGTVTIGHVSGTSLAFGSELSFLKETEYYETYKNQLTASPNLAILLALITAVAALIFAFMKPFRGKQTALLVANGIGFLSMMFGYFTIIKDYYAKRSDISFDGDLERETLKISFAGAFFFVWILFLLGVLIAAFMISRKNYVAASNVGYKDYRDLLND